MGRLPIAQLPPDKDERKAGRDHNKNAMVQWMAGAGVKPGDRVAGIMAAKRTAELIPLCHPLSLDDVQVVVELDDTLPGVRVAVEVRTHGRTGAEMEALTAASVTLLTIYDMMKATDREMVIGDIVLDRKSGGTSGEYSRLDGTGPAR